MSSLNMGGRREEERERGRRWDRLFSGFIDTTFQIRFFHVAPLVFEINGRSVVEVVTQQYVFPLSYSISTLVQFTLVFTLSKEGRVEVETEEERRNNIMDTALRPCVNIVPPQKRIYFLLFLSLVPWVETWGL